MNSSGIGMGEKLRKDGMRREGLDGRRTVKEHAAADKVRAKKLKRSDAAIHLKEQHVTEITRRNEVLLFMNGPWKRRKESLQ